MKMTTQIKVSVRAIAVAAVLAVSLIGVRVDLVAAQDVAGKIVSETTNSGKPGLLVLSHGAPQAEWNEPVLDFVDQVREMNEEEKVFHEVEGAFLEFAQPDAAAGVAALEKAGCDRIIVVPLFIAPSSHSLFDVPAVLGLYSSPSIRAILEEEGARIAQPGAPVTITQTLSEGDILDRFARDEILAHSQQPSEEAVVLLAHGSSDHYRLVNSSLRRIGSFLSGQCQIDYADWAYCAVGQTFMEEAYPAIISASEAKKRVIVVGLYISSSASSIYARALRQQNERNRSAIEEELAGRDILFSQKSLVEYDKIAGWVLDCAAGALNAVRVTPGEADE